MSSQIILSQWGSSEEIPRGGIVSRKELLDENIYCYFEEQGSQKASFDLP